MSEDRIKAVTVPLPPEFLALERAAKQAADEERVRSGLDPDFIDAIEHDLTVELSRRLLRGDG